MKRLLVIPLVLLILRRVDSQNPITGNARPCGQDNLSCVNLVAPDNPDNCLVLNQLCDGTNDCLVGIDEGVLFPNLNCTGVFGMYRCTVGDAITLDLLCDGVSDCAGGEDEVCIICENKCLLPYYGGCEFTRECVSTELDHNCGDCLTGFTPDLDGNPMTGLCLPAVFLTLDATSYNTSEDDDAVQVCVSGSVGTGNLSDIAGQSFEVDLQLFDGSAIYGVDYNWTSTPAVVTLTFDSTNLLDQQCRNISIIDDNLIEGEEAFSVFLTALSNTNGQIMLQTSSANISIADNDVATLMMTSSVLSVREGDSGVDVCVEISGVDSIECEVTGSFISTGSSAVAGMDFTAPSPEEVTFTSGSTGGSTSCATYTIENNIALEGDRNFTVELTSAAPSGSVVVDITSSTTVITIQDNEGTDAQSSEFIPAVIGGVVAVIAVLIISVTIIVIAVLFLKHHRAGQQKERVDGGRAVELTAVANTRTVDVPTTACLAYGQIHDHNDIYNQNYGYDYPGNPDQGIISTSDPRATPRASGTYGDGDSHDHVYDVIPCDDP